MLTQVDSTFQSLLQGPVVVPVAVVGRRSLLLLEAQYLGMLGQNNLSRFEDKYQQDRFERQAVDIDILGSYQNPQCNTPSSQVEAAVAVVAAVEMGVFPLDFPLVMRWGWWWAPLLAIPLVNL